MRFALATLLVLLFAVDTAMAQAFAPKPTFRTSSQAERFCSMVSGLIVGPDGEELSLEFKRSLMDQCTAKRAAAKKFAPKVPSVYVPTGLDEIEELEEKIKELNNRIDELEDQLD